MGRSQPREVTAETKGRSERARAKVYATYARHYSRGNVKVFSDDLNESDRASLAMMYSAILGRIPQGKPILDLGCGSGVLLGWLAQQSGASALGIDGSAGQVEAARVCSPYLDIRRADALPFLRDHPAEFGAIFCMDVLEHQATLDECLELVEVSQEALAMGGAFVCKVPNGANLTGSHLRYLDLTHERAFTSSSVLQLLEAAGLEECEIIPLRVRHASGRARLLVEDLLHRIIFRICGHGLERVFTRTISAVGWKQFGSSSR
jgi:predicted TPR repeat methyltransferase